MNDERDIERILRDHEHRVDPRVKREVLDEFARSRARTGRWTKAVGIAAALVLLLGASFYAGRVSKTPRETNATKSAATAELHWSAAESDLL